MSPVKPTISILSPATGSVFVLPLPPRTALSEAHFAEEGSGEGELGGASVEGEDETDEEGGGEEVELVELIEEAQELVRVPVQIELKAESFEGWGASAAVHVWAGGQLVSIISGPLDQGEQSVHGPGHDHRSGVLHGLGSIKVCMNLFFLSYFQYHF